MMGQARRRLEVKVDMQQMAKERAEYRKSIPLRIVKAVSAFVLLIPLTMIAFAAQSFSQNKWPWHLQ
jgi:hypothetical protein